MLTSRGDDPQRDVDPRARTVVPTDTIVLTRREAKTKRQNGEHRQKAYPQRSYEGKYKDVFGKMQTGRFINQHVTKSDNKRAVEALSVRRLQLTR